MGTQVRDEDEPDGWEWGLVEGFSDEGAPLVRKDGWDEPFEWFDVRRGPPAGPPVGLPVAAAPLAKSTGLGPNLGPNPGRRASSGVVVRCLLNAQCFADASLNGSLGPDEAAAWEEEGFEVECDSTLPVSLLLSNVLRKCGERANISALERLPSAEEEEEGEGICELDLEDEVGAVLRTGDVIRAKP